MNATEIIKLLNEKYPKKEIIGIRGLTKSNENEFSFRYVYRNGDYLSVSDLMFATNNKLKSKTKKVALKKAKQVKQNG